MSKCTSGCPTQDHASYSECLRSKGTKVAYCNSASGQDYTAQKTLDRDLDAYKAARAQGVQPASTQRSSVETAMRISNEAGKAWQA